MKKLLLPFVCGLISAFCLNAQTVQSQIVQGGGTGPFKALVAADASLPDFTIYRPGDIQRAVDSSGRLPVILYANGACANNNQQMRYLLSEVASHGYIAIAIGPYDEADVTENWNNVFSGKPQKQTGPLKETYASQLLEALDWITKQNADEKSEYYHTADLDNVVAMGQSCGGAQALAVSYDPRIKTLIMMNSGMGGMSMAGASEKCYNNLHSPVLFLNGGPTDIAYENAKADFGKVSGQLCVMVSTTDGHHGTYYKDYGGEYGTVVLKWLDWQLKGKIGQCGIFLDREYFKMRFPQWSLSVKGQAKENLHNSR